MEIYSGLYRSPSLDHNSPNFQAFLSNFRNLYAKLKAFTVFFYCRLNAHSQFWWPNVDTTLEGTKIEDLTSLGL